jgi:alkaline phosphatase D
MIIDDHEIENSFTEGAKAYASGGLPFISKNKERLMNGMTAIYSYQMSHGPIFDTQPDAAQAGVSFVKGQGNHQTPANHFASTKINDVGLFLTDTRKDRTKTLLMSREQEEDLKAFLSDDTTRVKLIASSVTFLGDRGKKPKKADNWMRAYKQRKRILKHIVTHDIKNVVFLSGDIHSHYATQFCVNGEKLPVYQLVSGSLFWPTSFLIDKIRWTRKKTRWGHVYGSPSSYSITEPLSLTHYDFFEGNGIGHVLVEDNQLIFKVFNHEHKVVIATELGLA